MVWIIRHLDWIASPLRPNRLSRGGNKNRMRLRLPLVYPGKREATPKFRYSIYRSHSFFSHSLFAICDRDRSYLLFYYYYFLNGFLKTIPVIIVHYPYLPFFFLIIFPLPDLRGR